MVPFCATVSSALVWAARPATASRGNTVSSPIRTAVPIFFPIWAGPDISATGRDPLRVSAHPPISSVCSTDCGLKGNDQEAQFDLGIATQNMLLAAMENNIGGCRIGAFSAKLAGLFTLAEHQELSLVIALGYPVETVIIEDKSVTTISAIGVMKKQTHHVPKRSLDDIIISV
jgi:hypothetical protein